MSEPTHLVSKQDLDGDRPGGGGRVLDRDGVVGVGDDVKLHVLLLLLLVARSARLTLHPYAHLPYTHARTPSC